MSVFTIDGPRRPMSSRSRWVSGSRHHRPRGGEARQGKARRGEAARQGKARQGKIEERERERYRDQKGDVDALTCPLRS